MTKLKHHNRGKTANSPNPLGIKVWITLPSQGPQVTEVVAGGKGNTE